MGFNSGFKGLKLQCQPRCTVRTFNSLYAAGLDAITISHHPHVSVRLAAIHQGKAEGLSWQHWRIAGVSRMRDAQDDSFPEHYMYPILCILIMSFPTILSDPVQEHVK